jgi:signal transduction histidine kinase
MFLNTTFAQTTFSDYRNIWGPTEFFEDPTRQIPLADVLKNEFGGMPKKNWMENSHTNALSRIWLRFRVENPNTKDTLKFLFFTGVHSRTELFEIRGEAAVKLAEGGLYARMAAKEGQFNPYCLPLVIPPDNNQTYLVAIHNYFKMYDQVRAEIYTPDTYQSYCLTYKNQQLPYLLFLGFTIGGLAVLCVFGLMQFLLTHGPAYIWYALFALVNALNFIRVLEMFADTGYISDTIPVFRVYFMVAPAATTYCYLKFTWYFLDFQLEKNAQRKWFGRLVHFFGAVFVFTSIVAVLIYEWPELSDLVVIWFRLMHVLIYSLGIFIFVQVIRAKGILNLFIATGTFLLLVGGILSTTMEWGFEQKPLHEIFFPYDPKAPLCIFNLLEGLCFALGLGYKTKILEIEKREAILEQERQRQRIAGDLHDEMGSTLSSISILSEIAMRHLNEGIDRDRFGVIGGYARQVAEAMKDIVWSINPRNDTMEIILQRMREFSGELFEPQNMTLHFHADEVVKTLNLPMEQRKDFYLLFKEAANNAAKYSGATEVWVLVQSDNGSLRLEVRDNGRGFDPATVKQGNGLWNMQRRTERMGGKLLLESKVGEGTRVELSLAIIR